MAEPMNRRRAGREKPGVLAGAMLAGIALTLATSLHAATPDSDFDCLIEPMLVTDVGSAVQGVVEHIVAKRGQSVQAGEPILQLRASIERSNVEHAGLRLAMNSEIDARKADVRLAELALSRARSLQKQNLAASQELDEARARHQVALASLQQAIDNMALMKVEQQRAEALLAQKVIRSPIDGVVTSINTSPGEFVYDKPVMTIVQLDPLRIETLVSARHFGAIRVGDKARVLPELGEQPLETTVELVDPLLDSRSGTFGVRMIVDNPEGAIVAGQRCSVRFTPADEKAS